jgi:hypothetical protein
MHEAMTGLSARLQKKRPAFITTLRPAVFRQGAVIKGEYWLYVSGAERGWVTKVVEGNHRIGTSILALRI